MPPYEIGDADLDARIRALAADAVANHPHEHGDADLIAEMMVSALKFFRDDADRGDLKLVNSALKEMRYSFLVFSRYRDTRKVTIFGSARTRPGEPNYEMASDFARVMSDERQWMVITGAGPGIMEAGNRGAGIDGSFGVNIRLPFEAEANPYIHESRLVNFKYFFTRKLAFMKESHAFALFPGGFGTLDESFELLTLIQTGKSDMHPIVLIEAPGTDYWQGWLDFVRQRLLAKGMIAAHDLDLIRLVTSVTEAADEICRFYANYHSQRYVDNRLILRLTEPPGPEIVARLNEEYADILVDGTIEATEATDPEKADGDHPGLPRLRLHFDRRSFGRLRAMIDELNLLVDTEREG
jgi:uncharacterized protein (TIGR00730 family)